MPSDFKPKIYKDSNQIEELLNRMFDDKVPIELINEKKLRDMEIIEKFDEVKKGLGVEKAFVIIGEIFNLSPSAIRHIIYEKE